MTEEKSIHPEYNLLISDGIQFLESMNRIYGPERAHELWLGMKEAMGREVQLDIFSAMLKGESSGTIKFRVVHPDTYEAVNTIKAIREYAGCGLKEAKDIWDLAKSSGQWQTIKYHPYNNTGGVSKSQFRSQIVRRLREMGHEVF